MSNYQKFILMIVILGVIVLAVVLLLLNRKHLNNNLSAVKINGQAILVEVARTQLEKIKGLSKRPDLPENQGMLFVYETPDFYSFWMKDMLFPLDFVWISQGKVVEITENVKPEDYQPPKTIAPKEKVDMILEVNTGVVQKQKIRVGDEVSIQSF